MSQRLVVSFIALCKSKENADNFMNSTVGKLGWIRPGSGRIRRFLQFDSENEKRFHVGTEYCVDSSLGSNRIETVSDLTSERKISATLRYIMHPKKIFDASRKPKSSRETRFIWVNFILWSLLSITCQWHPYSALCTLPICFLYAFQFIIFQSLILILLSFSIACSLLSLFEWRGWSFPVLSECLYILTISFSFLYLFLPEGRLRLYRLIRLSFFSQLLAHSEQLGHVCSLRPQRIISFRVAINFCRRHTVFSRVGSTCACFTSISSSFLAPGASLLI